jgi:group I intron endonuclease
MGCIYLVTNTVDGKKYVGQHNKQDITKRWNEHIYDSERGCDYVLHKAIRKYGKDAFTIEILCIVPNGDAVCRMEEYFAEQFETYVWDEPGGYNMIWCGKRGRSGIKSSPTTIKKQSEAMKALRAVNAVSDETRSKMSESMKGRVPPNKGVPISEEKREKVRDGVNAYFSNPENRKRLSETMKQYYSVNPISAEQRKKMSSKPVDDTTRQLLSERTSATWEREHASGSGRASKHGRFIYLFKSGNYNVRVPGMPSKTFPTLEEAIVARDEFLSKIQA